MTPVCVLKSVYNETARHYLGTTTPLVSPAGERCECADDAPVDLWMVVQGDAHVSFVRNPSGAPLPPPYENYCEPSEQPLSWMCKAYRSGEWDWYPATFADIAVRAMNAGVLPDHTLNHAVGLFGFEVVAAVFDGANERLDPAAKERLNGFADTPAEPATIITLIGENGEAEVSVGLRR